VAALSSSAGAKHRLLQTIKAEFKEAGLEFEYLFGAGYQRAVIAGFKKWEVPGVLAPVTVCTQMEISAEMLHDAISDEATGNALISAVFHRVKWGIEDHEYKWKLGFMLEMLDCEEITPEWAEEIRQAWGGKLPFKGWPAWWVCQNDRMSGDYCFKTMEDIKKTPLPEFVTWVISVAPTGKETPLMIKELINGPKKEEKDSRAAEAQPA